jgi:hypothetical protein
MGCHDCQGTGKTGMSDSPCPACMGRGYVDGPEEAASTAGGSLGLLALIALGLAGLMALVLTVEMWKRADGVLRPMLEALPGDAVAESADEHGSPLLIAVLVGSLVLGCCVALSRWRRGLIGDYLRGEQSYSVLLGASIVRMVAIIGGVSLIPILAAIADGADLRAEPDNGTVLDAAWRFVVAGAGLAVFTYLGLGRRIDIESRKPLHADDLPARAYRR